VFRDDKDHDFFLENQKNKIFFIFII